MFTDNEIAYMKSLGLNMDFNKLSNNDYGEIEEAVASKLETSGFDENYQLTDDGIICEEILNKIP